VEVVEVALVQIQTGLQVLVVPPSVEMVAKHQRVVMRWRTLVQVVAVVVLM
jgi:hypothetical protein